LVETLDFPEHPAEHGIVYDVFVAAPSSHEDGIESRFPPADSGKRDAEGIRKKRSGNSFFNMDKGKRRFRIQLVKQVGLTSSCARGAFA